jgi:hypothetical protein
MMIKRGRSLLVLAASMMLFSTTARSQTKVNEGARQDIP